MINIWLLLPLLISHNSFLLTASYELQQSSITILPIKGLIIRPFTSDHSEIRQIFWPQVQIPMIQVASQDQLKISTVPEGVVFINSGDNQLVPVKKDLQLSTQHPQFCSFKRSSSPLPIIQNNTQRERLVATNYGFNMYIDTRDSSVSNIISITGTWEPENINLIGHIVKKGDKILNLGAQTGLEILVMGKIIGPTGKIFAFQPYTVSFNILKKNIEINNLANITTLYKKGASDQKGRAQITIDYSNTGGSQIGPKIPEQKQDQINISKGPSVLPGSNKQIQFVQVDLVDNLLPQDVQLNFALLDVQKLEIKALRGMKKIIERSPNLIMMVEWQYLLNPTKNPFQTRQFLDWILGRGYKVYIYHGESSASCRVGNFYQLTIEKLLIYPILVDIYFFPSTVRLPQ